MTWAKIDDQLHAHRKAKLAWKHHPRALGLHLLALSYCAGHLTDGFVDLEFVEEKLPSRKEREAVTSALVSAGLWTADDGGWRINDWLDYNPSRADVLEKRRQDAKRKQQRRGEESAQSPNGRASESVSPRGGAPVGVSRPVPSSPLPPLPPVGGSTRKRVAYEGELHNFSAEHFPNVPDGLIAHCAAQLRSVGEEPTPDALRPLVQQHAPVEAPAA